MAKKYKQNVKLGRNAIITLVAIVVVVACVFIFTNLPSDKKNIASTYTSLSSESHVFKSISYNSLMDKIEDGEEVFVFIGSKDCTACQSRISLVNTTAQTLLVTTIYYLNDNSLTTDQRKSLVAYGVRKSFRPQLLCIRNNEYVSGTFQFMFGKQYVESEDTEDNFQKAIVRVLNS